MRRILLVVLTIALPAAGLRAADAPVGRLGATVVPVSQSIVLELDPRQADYTGSTETVLDVKTSVLAIRFHAEELDLRKIELARSGVAAAPVALTPKVLEDGMIEASASAAIAPGRYTLRIEFKNNFDTEAKGLYRLKSGDAWYAFTQFEAVDAREAFPCWDEPAFKIPYSITITAPADQSALANTPEQKTSTAGSAKTTFFKTTRPLPSYLLAIAVGPFETVPVPGTSIPTRIVTVKGASRLAADAVAVTPPILAALEKYFGSKYPYEKLDLIAVPEYWYGAMENPGLITFVDRALLLDQKTASDASRKTLEVDIAHEIAHMWFGDLVTMAWWDDLWLNESFATWMEQKILIQLFPEQEERISQVRSAQGVMETDSLLSTRAMRQPVQSIDSLLQSADALAYSKGAAVLDMLEGWLTPETFRAGVLDYLKAHADGNATADDLWAAMGKASKSDVRGILSSFLDQPGVPLVSVETQPGGKLRLTQTRFLAQGTTAPKPQLWTIPVVLRLGEKDGSRSKRVLLTKAETIVSLEGSAAPAWIEPNADETGYYRWSIGPEATAALAARASQRLTARERVGLLGNTRALMSAGRLSGDATIGVLESFASDPDPEVLREVVDGIAQLRQTFFSESESPEFAAFVRRTLSPVLARIGASPKAGESPATARLRPELLEALADEGKDETALAAMEKLARAYLGDRTSVDPSLVHAAIDVAAIRGNAELFDTYTARFESATIPAERSLFLRALGNFRDPALVDRALGYILKGPLRPQELEAIPRVMGSVPTSRAAMWAWVTAHYEPLAARIPSDYMIYFPWFAAGCSADRLVSARAFFADPKHAPPGTETELKRMSESVNDCVALDAREGPSVRRSITTIR